MAWRGEVEDGTGCGGLVASKSEQRAEARQAALEKDAQRYRKWRAAYTSPDGRPHAVDPMLAALADAWTPEQVDAAIDAAPAVRAA